MKMLTADISHIVSIEHCAYFLAFFNRQEVTFLYDAIPTISRMGFDLITITAYSVNPILCNEQHYLSWVFFCVCFTVDFFL